LLVEVQPKALLVVLLFIQDFLLEVAPVALVVVTQIPEILQEELVAVAEHKPVQVILVLLER
jgi:hypothetical protein